MKKTSETKFSKSNIYRRGIPLIAVIFGLLIFVRIPYPIFQNTQTEQLVPYEEITDKNPLENCIILPYQSQDGEYFVDRLDLLFGTYNRQNSSNYTLQIFDENKQIYVENFKASEIKDNQFKSFYLQNSKFGSEKFCFKISTKDGTLGNAITVWQNGQGDPVLKIFQNFGLLTINSSQNIFFMLDASMGMTFLLLYLLSLAIFVIVVGSTSKV